MSSAQKNKNTFVHAGFISKINSDSVIVTLEPNIQCEACHVKGTCGVSDSSTKQVEIPISRNNYRINEQVDVILKKALGLKAVFWAYVFPFILMFSTLILASFFVEEWLAGLMSLLIIVPYYLVLYLLKSTLKSAFKVSILKI
jgi:sigma-E factor negative regulatory protein RseC